EGHFHTDRTDARGCRCHSAGRTLGEPARRRERCFADAENQKWRARNADAGHRHRRHAERQRAGGRYGLAELLAGVRGVEGKLGSFDLRLSARGDQLNELVRSLDVRLDIERGRLSYGNIEGGRPVDFTLAKLKVVLPAGKAL